MRRPPIAAIAFPPAGRAWSMPARAAEPEIAPFDRSGIRPEEMMDLMQLGAMPLGTLRRASALLFDPLLGYDLPAVCWRSVRTLPKARSAPQRSGRNETLGADLRMPIP